MKGMRTVAVNAGLAALMGGLSYVGGVDWTQYVSPTAALVLTNILNISLRAITTTPIGKK